MSRILNNFKKNIIIQRTLCVIRISYYPFYKYITKRFEFTIASPLETVKQIQKGNSLVRFGDGEFTLIKGHSIGFQSNNESLKKSLVSVLEHKDGVYLIGLPHGFLRTNGDRLPVKTFWWSYVVRNRKLINFLTKESRSNFFDTNFSRTVTELKDTKEIDSIVSETKKVWENRKVLVIEGSQTRFGVQNDLFNKARSVKRILAPSTGAYDKLDLIYDFVINQLDEGHVSDDTLVLIALGPAATVLGAKLANRLQCVDIGHFDLQYEYYLQGEYKKVKIKTRYDNEAVNGDAVVNLNDSNYSKQIIYTV